MARTMTGAAVGRVNRRFLFLAFILAALAGVLWYVGFSRSGDDATPAAVSVDVVVAKETIPPGTELTAEMLEVRSGRADIVGAGYIGNIEDAVGQVARYPIEANEPVLQANLVGGTVLSPDGLSYKIEEGLRAVSIGVDQVTNVGGLALPGDHVDILWMPAEQNQNLDQHEGARLVADNVEVLAVQQTIVDIGPQAPGITEEEGEGTTAAQAPEDDRIRASDAEPNPDATTLTLLVTPEQARNIFCAQQSGILRLVLRAFGDEQPTTGVPISTCILLPEEEQPPA